MFHFTHSTWQVLIALCYIIALACLASVFVYESLLRNNKRHQIKQKKSKEKEMVPNEESPINVEAETMRMEEQKEECEEMTGSK